MYKCYACVTEQVNRDTFLLSTNLRVGKRERERRPQCNNLSLYHSLCFILTFSVASRLYRGKVLRNSRKTVRRVPEFNKIRDVASTRSHFVAAHSRVESLRKFRQHPPFQPSFQLPCSSLPSTIPLARKSVQTICHALHLREKSRDLRALIVTPLSYPCIICHNRPAIRQTEIQ